MKDSRKSYKHKVISVLYKWHRVMCMLTFCCKKQHDIIELSSKNNKRELKSV